MPFDLNGNPTLDADVTPRSPSLTYLPLADLASPTEIGGTTPAAGNFTNLDASGTLNADGAATLNDALTVAGAVTLQDALAVTGALTATGGVDGVLGGVTPAAATVTTLTASGAAALNGGITCDTDKFTVADTSGNTRTKGTLIVDLTSTLTGVVTATAGILQTAQSLTAAADSGAGSSITAGIINAVVVGVTTNADDWIVLPAIAGVPIGHTITIACNASSNFEMRTPALSGTTINGQDCDGTKEYLCTDTEVIKVTKATATGWVATALSALGAVVAAVVPD